MKNKTFRRCVDLAKPHLKTIAVVSIFSIILDLIEIFKPYLIKVLIDDYLSLNIYQKGFISVVSIGIIYLIVAIIEYIIDLFTNIKTNNMGEEILFSLRNRIFKYTQEACITFHDKVPAGTLYVRITNDVDDISSLFKDVVTTFFKDIISIIAILGIMLYFSFKLSLVTFIIIPFVIITSIVLTIILNKLYDKSKVIRTNLNVFLAESIYGAKLIKIFNIQDEQEIECKEITKKYEYTRFPTSIFEGLFPGMMLLFENLAIAIIIYAVIYKWLGIQVEVGSIYIFTTYIKNLFDPINRIIDNVEIIQEAQVSINKIYDIIEHDEYLEDLNSGKEIENPKGKIEFKHVWFSYDNKNWILKDISFTINPKETIALVGRTGSGKTTITNLINRFYDVTKGEILLDGVNINEYSKKSLREHIGTVLQDPFVFAKSIEDNIKLNKKIKEQDVRNAVEMASAKDFVFSLPHGIKEVAQERGESFSAGEKQLLAFARIFAHNPDIFILDEATANIDTNTESLIQKSINFLSKEKSAIFIAHRLSTIVNVDKILVLQNGEIIEEGNHNELLNKDGYYAKLYNSFYESLG